MTKQRILLGVILSFSMTGLAGQPGPRPQAVPRQKPRVTGKQFFEAMRENRRQRGMKRLDLAGIEAWKRRLRVSEQQWRIIEPRKEKVRVLRWDADARSPGLGPERNQAGYHFIRNSKGGGILLATPPEEMTEALKSADKLAELLDDPNSTDEQIREKIDALQQTREDARKALPQAKQELAKVLTTPRQEAVFLLCGYID